MRRSLVAAIDHEVSGELGWKDKRIPFNSPYGPLTYEIGLAHDSLEHFALETVSDEIMAHAAMYWGRYQGGYCSPYGRGLTLEDIGSEWIQLCHAVQSGNYLKTPPRTCKLESDAEEDISTIIAAGRRAIRSEYEHDERPLAWLSTANEIEKVFRGWFRLGYRKADRVYRKGLGWDPSTFSHYFGQLAERFKRTQPQYEGQEICLEIEKGGFRLQEVEAEVY
jgi:hypothetical protein